jgi:uncharacterized protein YlaI
MTKPEYRLAEQNAHCRVCDKVIERKVDYMVSWYSFRNRGQNIHICPDCVKELYYLVINAGEVVND